MDVTVGFTTQLKAALGKGRQSINLREGATVQDAIDLIADIHADEFSRLVLSNGKILPSILLSVNDQQVDVEAVLCDGDTLTLLSAISGG